MLDTLVYIKHETRVWLDITTLLIPGHNDSEEEIDSMTKWGVATSALRCRGISPRSIPTGRCSTARRHRLSYIVRGVGTFFLSLEIPNELVFFILVAVAIGPTFGTVAVQNVIFYETAGPRLAGMILGLSFIAHQIGSASGPMFASIAFDMTGSYDGFMVVMALILLGSGALIYSNTNRQTRFPEPVVSSSPARS